MQQCPKCKNEYPAGVGFCPKDGTRTVSQSLTSTASGKQQSLQVGSYRLLRKLGEGGMGVVFEAEHVIINKKVALKMLHADKANDTQISERFRREAKMASQIKNPHIVDIENFGVTENGDMYLVMEFLEGKDLSELLDNISHLPIKTAKHILLQAAQALGAAHKTGVVHRDLKPDNIFLVQKENDPYYVKLVDFGIAKNLEGNSALTKAGMIIGTPEYMSPEQCEGKPVDARSDIYALGVIAYQLVTGQVPFSHEHFSRVLLMHSGEAPKPPSKVNPALNLPVVVEETIMRCLAKKREDRFQTTDDLIRSLERWPETGMSSSRLPRPQPISNENKTLVLGDDAPDEDEVTQHKSSEATMILQSEYDENAALETAATIAPNNSAQLQQELAKAKQAALVTQPPKPPQEQVPAFTAQAVVVEDNDDDEKGSSRIVVILGSAILVIALIAGFYFFLQQPQTIQAKPPQAPTQSAP